MYRIGEDAGADLDGRHADGRGAGPDLFSRNNWPCSIRRRASPACAAARAASQSMRARLTLAAAVVGAEPASRAVARWRSRQDQLPDHHRQSRGAALFQPGLGLAYGFNHAGAIASFREAQRLDPLARCAGGARRWPTGRTSTRRWTRTPMRRAVGAARYAQWLAAKATPAERALDRRDGQALFARSRRRPRRARRRLCRRDARRRAAHPANDDIALLAAEAAMDTLPWNYWEPDRHAEAPPRRGDPAGRNGAWRAIPTIRRRRISTSI